MKALSVLSAMILTPRTYYSPILGPRLFLRAAGVAVDESGVVAFSLRHQHATSDAKVFFVFGAGLLAVVLLMIAQVWRDRMLGFSWKGNDCEAEGEAKWVLCLTRRGFKTLVEHDGEIRHLAGYHDYGLRRSRDRAQSD